MKLFELFWTFVKIGSMAFGGGYTIIAIVQKSLVEQKKWITEDELMDYLAMSQSLPGIIAINFSAFVGFKSAQFWGAVTAVLGVILAPTLVVIGLAQFIHHIHEYPIFISALIGVKMGVCALIVKMAFTLCRHSLTNGWAFVIYGMAIVSFLIFNLSPVIPLIGAGIFGCLYCLKMKKVFK